jgi:hypothetical protein
MRPIRTIAPLALGLAALAVAGCQSRADQTTTTAIPTRPEPAVSATTAPARQAPPPTTAPKPAPQPETIVGIWPARTFEQARAIQDGADAGHQPWLLSPELVSTSYAAAELGLHDPVARRVGTAVYQVGARGSEWAATLHLAQPVRQGAGGVWVVTRVGG